MSKTDLTDKEIAFVDAYCSNGLNATQAVLQAYEVTGNKSSVASTMGVELLAKERVATEVTKRMGDLKDSLGLGIKEAIAIARKWLSHKDRKTQEFAMKYLQTLSPLLNNEKPTANTHNHLHLPKR